MTSLSAVREKLEAIVALESAELGTTHGMRMIRMGTLAREALELMDSAEGKRVEGGISLDDAYMLAAGMGYEVEFDPRAMIDNKPGFTPSTLLIPEPRELAGGEDAHAELKRIGPQAIEELGRHDYDRYVAAQKEPKMPGEAS